MIDTNLSVGHALEIAKLHSQRGEAAKAQMIYEAILQTCSHQKKNTQIEFLNLNKRKKKNTKLNPPKELIDSIISLYNQGQLSILVKEAQTLTKKYPDSFIVWNILGVANIGLGQFESASKALKKVVSLNSNFSDGFNNLGIAFQGQGMFDKAISAYNQALSLAPNCAETFNNMGNVFQDQGRLDDSIDAYHKAISLKPSYSNAYYNLGSSLRAKHNLEEAINAYKNALLLKPDYVEAYNNMANSLQDLGKLNDSLISFKKALSLKPDYAEAYNNMGITLQYQGKLKDAIEAYNKAIIFKPDYAEAHQNLGFAFLSCGRFSEGLHKNEWRWKTKRYLSRQRYFSRPLWDGKKSLKGKTILLWNEQGIGDTINWSSYIPLISRLARHCILECQEKLVPLLKRSFPEIDVKSENRTQDYDRCDFDFHLPMGSLYKNFFNEIFKSKKSDAYLFPDPNRIKFWKQRLNSLGKGPFIGICWKSSNMSPKRFQNYAKISEFYPLFKIPNLIFVNLQNKDFSDDLFKIENEFGIIIHNFDDLDHFDNIDDVAALCAALDVVVSTKTTVPLISSSVGTLTKLANWKQSSWNNILYNPIASSVDIFERDFCNTWENTFCEIAEDISKLAQNWSSR